MVDIVGKSKNGRIMHYSVGAIIERDRKYLLIDRVKDPLGYAGIAGHIDEGESVKEVFEECGWEVISCELVAEEELDFEPCSRGVDVHYWYVYKCKCEGDVKQDKSEAKSIDWYSVEEIKKLGMIERAWEYWFEKLGIVKF